MQNVFTLAICDFHSSEGVSGHTRDGTRERNGPEESTGLNAPTAGLNAPTETSKSSPIATANMRIDTEFSFLFFFFDDV